MKLIAILSGHSATDSGAVKYVCERDEVWKIANMVGEILEKKYFVRVMRDKWSDKLSDCIHKVNKYNCDFAFEFHENAGGGDGAECIIHNKSNQWMADEIKEAMEECGQNWRRTIVDPSFMLLNGTNCRSMIIECAFADNKKDIRDWDEDHEKMKMAESVAKHIAVIAKLKKRPIKKKFFKVEAKKDLLVREGYSLKSKVMDKKCYKGHSYTIVEKKLNRGRLKTGGWITITDKYVKRLK